MHIGILTDAFPSEVGGIQVFADQFVLQLGHHPDIDQVSVLPFADGPDEIRGNVRISRGELKEHSCDAAQGVPLVLETRLAYPPYSIRADSVSR